MLKVEITSENNKIFEIKEEQDNLWLNKEIFEWDLIEVKHNTFHIIYKHQSFNVEVLDANYQQKTFNIKVNDKVYVLQAKDRFDILLKKLGMDGLNTNKISEVKAPMPGLILNIMVEEGQSVSKGESLMILEAMKMENVLKSPTDGKIKTIRVKRTNNVEKNQVLIQFE